MQTAKATQVEVTESVEEPYRTRITIKQNYYFTIFQAVVICAAGVVNPFEITTGVK